MTEAELRRAMEVERTILLQFERIEQPDAFIQAQIVATRGRYNALRLEFIERGQGWPPPIDNASIRAEL